MYSVMGNSETEAGRKIGLFYAQNVNQPLYPPYASIGFLDNAGNLKGAVILTDYNGGNITVHMYMPQCMTKANIKVVMNYIFNKLNCSRLSAIIPRNNKSMLKLVERVNFKFEAVLKYYFGHKDSEDGIVFKMTSIEASKWIEINGIK